MTTSTNKRHARKNRKRAEDTRRGAAHEGVDPRIQRALMGTIGRPFA